MAIVNLTTYWRRLGTDPTDARGCRCDPNMVGHNWRCPAWRVGGAS